jgi:hypothetical protein
VTKKIQKRTITETLDNVSPCELESKLGDLLKWVQEKITEYGQDAYLAQDSYFHYDYDPRPPRFNIKRDRKETDDEYDKRIAKEKSDKALVEARELAELERLRKKFEGKK